MNKRGVGVRSRLFGILIGIGITSLVFVLAGFNSAHAETTLSISTPEDPILEVSLSSNLVQLDLAPTGGTAFSSADLTVTAGTNNIYGYELYMEVDSPNLTRIEPLANNTTPTINSLAENAQGYTEANFTANSWGYQLGGGNYFAIPLGSTLLDSSEGPTNASSTTITFASKVNMEQAAGSYSADIILRAITTTPPVIMQDIDTWRGSLAEGDTVSAQDIRDEKFYMVGKLADGRIWMLDHLALNLADSSVRANLTSSTTNASTTAINALLNGGRSNGAKYATAGVANWTSSYSYSAPLFNVSNAETIPSGATVGSKGSNKTGGYYNYCAASAGSYCYGEGTSAGSPSGAATEDICPAGWRMPTGGGSGEFQVLATAVTGVTGSLSGTQAVDFRTALSIPTPGYFDGGSVQYVGNIYIWTRTNPGSTTRMYLVSGGASSINPSGHDGRNYGFSLRCIARKPTTTITFNANGGEGTMSPQTIDEFDSAVTLAQNTFTREDYKFTGWNTKADGSGTSYTNGATYTGESVTLYAQWQDTYSGSFSKAFNEAGKTKVDINGAKYHKLQDMTSAICTEVDTEQYAQLVDIRDNTIYNVGKLADNRCWLTDNLAIDLGNSTMKANLTPETTNATSTTLNYLKNGGGSGQYARSGVVNWTSGNSYTSPLYNVNDKNVVDSNAPANDHGSNKMGGYYNYCAASAGSHCYDAGTAPGNATEDICPAGWRMPTGGGSGEYQVLATAITGTTGTISNSTQIANFRKALVINRPGYYDGGSLMYRGYGYFWASTQSGGYEARILGYRGDGTVWPTDDENRYYGFSVRCIAK